MTTNFEHFDQSFQKILGFTYSFCTLIFGTFAFFTYWLSTRQTAKGVTIHGEVQQRFRDWLMIPGALSTILGISDRLQELQQLFWGYLTDSQRSCDHFEAIWRIVQKLLPEYPEASWSIWQALNNTAKIFGLTSTVFSPNMA